MVPRRIHVFVALIPLLAANVCASAADWPNWRGPAQNGSSPDTNLPVRFSKTENVKWAYDLPGASASTPIIVGDHVYVSSIGEASKELYAICLDRRTGKELWRQFIAVGPDSDDRSNKASPSPTVEGDVVVFFYGSGDLAAFKPDGDPLWHRNIQKDYGDFAFLWTFSSSPLLYEHRLYLPVMQRDVPVRGRGRADGQPIESYLLAMNPQTGQTLWKQIRPSKAHAESHEAFTTPIAFEHDGRREILLAGGDCVTGHDPATGRELWRWGTWNPTRIVHWRLVCSPVAGGGVVVVCAPKGAPVYAVRAGGDSTLSDKDLAWVSDDKAISSDVATPAYHDGRFYILNGERKILSAVDSQSGDIAWRSKLKSKAIFRSSPTVADGRIYLMNHRGVVYVLDEKTGQVLHTAAMGERNDDNTRSSIAVADGDLYIKTNHKLFRIGR